MLPALSVTVKTPVLAPTCVGVNTTLIVQEALAANVCPQLLVSVKSLTPVEMPAMLSGASPGLDSVSDCAALDVPTDWPTKPRLAPDRMACACCAPWPLTRITCGLPEP